MSQYFPLADQVFVSKTRDLQEFYIWGTLAQILLPLHDNRQQANYKTRFNEEQTYEKIFN
jgi:hypothetical protein